MEFGAYRLQSTISGSAMVISYVRSGAKMDQR